MKRRLFILALTLCLLGGILSPAGGALAESYDVYVVSNTLKVYAKVSTSSKLLGTMSYGEKMRCLAVNSGWAAVQNSSGSIGYCKTSGLSANNPNNLDVKAYVTASNVPVYRRADSSSSVMMRLSKGSSYTAVAVTQDDEWVRLKNGSYYGYVQAKYLSRSAPSSSSSEETKVYVSSNTLTVYDRASTSGKSLGTMSYGESMTRLATSGDWARVRNSSGKVGYCKSSGLTTTNPNKLSVTAYATQDGVRVYRKPSTSSGVMMTLSRGDHYTCVAQTSDGDWLRLKNGNYYGYVQAKYFSNSAPADDTEETKVYVSSNTLTVYDRASTSGKSLGTMSYGESMTRLATSGDWARVRNSSGKVGYCKSSGLMTANPNKLSVTAYATQDGVRVYRKPSTSSGVMMTLSRGDHYTCVAQTPDGDWLRLKNGSYYGYVQAKYFSNSAPEEEVEEVQVYVISTTLTVYDRASTSGSSLGTMSFGESLTLLGVDDGWARVRNSGGSVGYCAYGGLSRSDPNTLNRACYAAEDGLALYAKPSQSARVVANVALNASLMAVAQSEDGVWARILLASGGYAYALVEKLSLEKLPEDNSEIQSITPVTVYISDTNLSFYASNDSSSASLGSLSFGESLRCTGRGGGWARVENASGSVGYCLESGLTSENPNRYSVALYAQSSGVRVYQRARSSSTVLATLSLNAGVTGVAISSDGEWVRLFNGSIYGYALASELATSRVEEEDSATVSAVIALAKSLQGVPYKYAAQSPSDGFDCSGFTYYVFKNAAGVTLKRTAKTQGYNDSYAKIESRGNLKAGDLVFFNTVSDDDDLCDHVGIYLGGNQFIHASSAKGEVTISSLGSSSSDYYYRTYSWGRRIIS